MAWEQEPGEQGNYQIVAFNFKYCSQIIWIVFCFVRFLKMNGYMFFIFKYMFSFSFPIYD